MNFFRRVFGAVIFNLFAVVAVHAAEVSCAYDANEEWPWWDERTCQTREPAIGAALLSNDATTSYPLCVDPASDPDGDGWGYENGNSCRVRAVDSGYPDCSDSSSDIDGDGWGWENGRSCVVKPVVDPKYPVCRARSSDPDGDGWGFEDGASCRVEAESEYPVCSFELIDKDGDGWGYENNQSCRHATVKKTVVFEQGFDSATAGPYTGAQLNADWNTPIWHLGFDQGRAHIVPESGRGNTLRVTYPANTYGAAGASAFLSDLEFTAQLPQSHEALYVSYDVKFGKGFDFVRGGKLPGLCGYDNTKTPGSGCNTGGGFPDGFDGWSARGMWREDGIMENYVYHASQENFYGDDEYWGESATPGQWHSIQHHVVLNSPGNADGILEAWFDGKKVLDERAFVYRKTANIGINLFYFSTFYGGNDPSWAPTEDQYVFFDNIRIATTPLAGTLQKGAALNDGSGVGESESNLDSVVRSSGGGAAGLSLLLLVLLRRSRKSVE